MPLATRLTNRRTWASEGHEEEVSRARRLLGEAPGQLHDAGRARGVVIRTGVHLAGLAGEGPFDAHPQVVVVGTDDEGFLGGASGREPAHHIIRGGLLAVELDIHIEARVVVVLEVGRLDAVAREDHGQSLQIAVVGESQGREVLLRAVGLAILGGGHAQDISRGQGDLGRELEGLEIAPGAEGLKVRGLELIRDTARPSGLRGSP